MAESNIYGMGRSNKTPSHKIFFWLLFPKHKTWKGKKRDTGKAKYSLLRKLKVKDYTTATLWRKLVGRWNSGGEGEPMELHYKIIIIIIKFSLKKGENFF